MARIRQAKQVGVGVCDAFFESEAGVITYLGLTKGGLTATYTPNWYEITTDQTGETPLDASYNGGTVEVTGDALDTTKEKIAMLFAESTLLNDAVTFGQTPGLRASDHCFKFVAHPVCMKDDVSRDLIIYRAYNKGNLELAFKLDDVWKIPLQISGLYDDFRENGDRLFRIGADADGGSDKRVVKFWITPSNPDVEGAGKTVAFSANAMYEDGTTAAVTNDCNWVSSTVDIASITNNGVATSVATGTTVIQATYAGYTSSTTLTVE